MRHPPTVDDVVREATVDARARITGNVAVIRADVDPEGVHQARVGCRRLRADLRAFASQLDRSWSEPLRDELRWLGHELGAVRDLDVLAERLRRAASTLDEPDRVVVEPAVAALAAERADRLADAVAALGSDRASALLADLETAAARPPTGPSGAAPAAEVIPGLVRRAHRRLRTAVSRLGPDPTDEELHRLRIRAKRARYAAEAAATVVGRPAERYAKEVGRLQDLLGEQHDAVVAEEWLRDAAARADEPGVAFVLGLLAARQRDEADRLRGRWRRAWKAVDRPKRTRWMRR